MFFIYIIYSAPSNLYGNIPYIYLIKFVMSYTKSKVKAQARFDARLTRSQKELFERAARIKGFKSLSEFVIHTTLEAALVIVEKENTILVSEADKKVFFNALINPPKPNRTLKEASKSYLKRLEAK